jgi:hypothetical protein
MGTRRWLARVVLLAVAAAGTSGLGLGQSAASANASVTLTARDISGTWEGSFRLDSAWGLPQRASARTTSARLRFDPVGDASPTTSSTRSVHPGTFDVDFSRFGFTLSTREALGWSVGTDSMRATLNPTVDHGLVEVHGTFDGEAIVGSWRYTSDPGGATGTFQVRKVSR